MGGANARIGGRPTTPHVHHLWRPSTSENNSMSRNHAEPVAGAWLCCARAPAHRHVAPRQPTKRNVFFVIAFPPGTIYGGSCGIALNSTTRRHPRLGLVSGSRGPTQIHIRGLCHWAGEPAGHLGAESPSRRTARPASARKTSSPCPHWLRGLSQTHHVNAVSRHRRVPPFASSRRPLTHALAHLQWQEPPRFIDASATSRASIKEPSPSRGPTTRPLRASPRHP